MQARHHLRNFSFLTKGENREILDNCFTALNEIHSCLNENIRKMAEDKLMGMIKQVVDDMIKESDYWIMKDKKNSYLYTLNQIDSKYGQDIKDFLSMAKNVEQKYSEDKDNQNMNDNITSGNPT